MAKTNPWGTLVTLKETDSYAIRLLTIDLKESTPELKRSSSWLQWTVISGRGKVYIGKNELFATPGCTYVFNPGDSYYVSNIGEVDLLITETEAK